MLRFRLGHLFLVPVIAFGLAAVLLWTSPPARVVRAQGTTPDTMVGYDGKRMNAPVSGRFIEPGFSGWGGDRGLSAAELIADPLRIFAPREPSVPGDIIGTDGRTQDTDTTTFPYRANVFLEITFEQNNTATCTGFMIGARTIATAGHCVYDPDTNDWADSITAYPGRDGNSTPYGSANGCYFWSVDKWVDNETKGKDYGAIILSPSNDLGNTTGWYGFRTDSDSELDELRVLIHGYPGDKPYGTMWGMRNRIKKVSNQQLKHNVDTFAGQSGSAVYHNYGGDRQAVGIHTSGLYGGSEYNRATRITDSVFDNLLDWKNNPDCTP